MLAQAVATRTGSTRTAMISTPASTGTTDATHRTTITRAHRLRGGCAAGRNRRGSTLMSVGLMWANRSGTPVRSATMW